jgi:hypothetical protein
VEVGAGGWWWGRVVVLAVGDFGVAFGSGRVEGVGGEERLLEEGRCWLRISLGVVCKGRRRTGTPSMALTSFTEILRPSSLMVMCALLEKAMQRRSKNSWRAELDTAVRMGWSCPSMAARD